MKQATGHAKSAENESMANFETVEWLDKDALIARIKPHVKGMILRTTAWRMVCNGQLVPPVDSVRHKHLLKATDVAIWIEQRKERVRGNA